MATDLILVSDQLGVSDCEFLRASGILAQPVNALTSLGFIAVGFWLIRRAGKRPDFSWFSERTFAVILVVLGIGSVAFHGPQPAGARWLHDTSILTALLFIVFFNLALVGRLTPWAARRIGPAVAGLVALIVAVMPDLGTILAMPIVGALVLVEVSAYRKIHQARLYAALGLLPAVGATLNLLSRTGGPLCDPTSIVQMHGLWHLLTAAAFGVWSTVAFPNQLATSDQSNA